MSVASVLERSGNVRDIREVLALPEIKPWELISEELAASHHYAEIISILYPDKDLKPLRENYINHIINQAAKDEARNLSKLSNLLAFFEVSNNERFIKKDFKNDVLRKKAREKSMEYLDEFDIDITLVSNFSHVDFIEFIYGVKLNFPSININPILEKYYKEFSTTAIAYINDRIYNSDNLANLFLLEGDLRIAAYFKLLFPEQCKEIDFTKTSIYEDGLRQFPQENNADQNYAGIAAYLKVLAASEARLGERGIELELPAKAINSPVITFPEIGRFDV